MHQDGSPAWQSIHPKPAHILVPNLNLNMVSGTPTHLTDPILFCPVVKCVSLFNLGG